MTYQVQILADSLSEENVRLTTFQLKYPRMIHSEFMTHRVFNRNASSSRAIPMSVSMKAVRDDPAMPASWGSNQKGMQAGEDLSGWRLALTKWAWNRARRKALQSAKIMDWVGAHKQVGNRILEPWSHISVIVTSVYWDNWYALRDHPDADPTIQKLAVAMKDLHNLSVPKILKHGEWHLPYILPWERDLYPLEQLKIMSAARSARVSYGNHGVDNLSSWESDQRLFKQLTGFPVHATPLEHQATPDKKRPSNGAWNNPKLHGSLKGWKQHRKMFPNEALMEEY